MITHRAALIAVVIAFATGLIGSLALRPPGQAVQTVASNDSDDVAVRVRWRVPQSTPSTLPVYGETLKTLRRVAHGASGGAIDLQLSEPDEMVPAMTKLAQSGTRINHRHCDITSPLACHHAGARFATTFTTKLNGLTP